jgi:hypothetical protein
MADVVNAAIVSIPNASLASVTCKSRAVTVCHILTLTLAPLLAYDHSLRSLSFTDMPSMLLLPETTSETTSEIHCRMASMDHDHVRSKLLVG